MSMTDAYGSTSAGEQAPTGPRRVGTTIHQHTKKNMFNIENISEMRGV